jgi:hypothetical protein
MVTKEQLQATLEASSVPILVESFRDELGDFQDYFARLKEMARGSRSAAAEWKRRLIRPANG